MPRRNKNAQKQRRKDRQNLKEAYVHKEDDFDSFEGVEHFQHSPAKHKCKPLEAKNQAQGQYMATIQSKVITFGIGPAGTGKTFIAAAMAADALANKEVDKIVITRPAIGADEDPGALPGDIDEKYDPYIAPFLEVLNDRLGASHVRLLRNNGRILSEPLAFMRGKTFNKSFVVLDEAQNTTVSQMKMFLTRFGDDSKVVVNGDIKQCDLKNRELVDGMSGLEDAVRRLRKKSGDIAVCEFTKEDSIRHGLTKTILEAYEG